MKNCQILLGNSSSGIVESCTFNIPTVNLGERQKGKLIPSNVINCEFDFFNLHKLLISILKKIKKKKIKNPYGDGKSGKRIVKLLSKINLKKNRNYVKGFVSLK